MQPGDKVKVTGGGYKGSTGIVQELDGDLAKVAVDSFGMPMTARISLSQLEAMDAVGAAAGSVAGPATPAATIDAGDQVNVTGGGYKGSLGVVEEIDGDLAKVKVESFGMPMSVRIPLSQLEKRVDGQKS